jgi:hypothetical protein
MVSEQLWKMYEKPYLRIEWRFGGLMVLMDETGGELENMTVALAGKSEKIKASADCRSCFWEPMCVVGRGEVQCGGSGDA